MPTFITIGYGDQAGYDRTPKPLRDAAHAHDASLVAAVQIVAKSPCAIAHGVVEVWPLLETNPQE